MSIVQESGSMQRLKRIEKRVEAGIIAGIASAFVNIFMLTATGKIQELGWDGPMYSVMAVLDENSAIKKHMADVRAGDPSTFQQESFMLGVAVCLLLGCLSGIIFNIGMRRYVVRGPARYLVGALHGIIMMCLFYLGVLGVFRMAGYEVDAYSLATMIGWPAMVAIHAIHGVVLAAIMRTQLTRTDNVFVDSIDVSH